VRFLICNMAETMPGDRRKSRGWVGWPI